MKTNHPHSMRMHDVHDADEIRKLLQDIFLRGEDLFLWQPQKSIRLKLHGVINSLDEIRKIIEVIPQKDQFFLFKSNQPIYLFCQHLHTVFKTFLVFNSQHRIAFSMPQQLKRIDSRKILRQEYKSVHAPEYVYFSALTSSGKIFDQKKRLLIDRSSLGLAFEISLFEEAKISA